MDWYRSLELSQPELDRLIEKTKPELKGSGRAVIMCPVCTGLYFEDDFPDHKCDDLLLEKLTRYEEEA